MARARVLVVEDSPTILAIKVAILESAGYETVGAVDAIEAILRVREDAPDLILLDVRLPDMNGYQVCRLLRNDDEHKDIPIIMASASDTEKKDEFWGVQTGADAYLVEPFEPQELLGLVQFVMRARMKDPGPRRGASA
ncbi:MAG: response regulator [Candidatus Eisenbacteria bacterium]